MCFFFPCFKIKPRIFEAFLFGFGSASFLISLKNKFRLCVRLFLQNTLIVLHPADYRLRLMRTTRLKDFISDYRNEFLDISQPVLKNVINDLVIYLLIVMRDHIAKPGQPYHLTCQII